MSFKNREVLKQKPLTDMAWHNSTTHALREHSHIAVLTGGRCFCYFKEKMTIRKFWGFSSTVRFAPIWLKSTFYSIYHSDQKP